LSKTVPLSGEICFGVESVLLGTCEEDVEVEGVDVEDVDVEDVDVGDVGAEDSWTYIIFTAYTLPNSFVAVSV
jgi:hypothetical protein